MRFLPSTLVCQLMLSRFRPCLGSHIVEDSCVQRLSFPGDIISQLALSFLQSFYLPLPQCFPGLGVGVMLQTINQGWATHDQLFSTFCSFVGFGNGLHLLETPQVLVNTEAKLLGHLRLGVWVMSQAIFYLQHFGFLLYKVLPYESDLQQNFKNCLKLETKPQARFTMCEATKGPCPSHHAIFQQAFQPPPSTLLRIRYSQGCSGCDHAVI